MRTPNFPLGAVLAAGLAVLPLTAAAAETAETTADASAAAVSVESDARQGDPFAQFVVGRRELVRAANENDPERARVGLDYLSRSAGAGFAPAARFAGSVYLTGEYVPRDLARALDWFTRAASLGDADSQRVLGTMYYDGDLIPKDLAQAVHHWDAYVENPGALHEPEELYETAYRLGVLYAQGAGTPADGERARVLWTRAAERGAYPPAIEALAAIRAKADPTGAAQDYLSAARAYLHGGLRYDIAAADAEDHARRILAEIERLAPGDRAILRLKAELAAAEAMRQKPPHTPLPWATS
jgi:TPR repeat protein